MVLKGITVTYEICKCCGSSSSISCYQPNTFISLQALKSNLKRSCNKCGATLGIKYVKAKLIKKE